MQLLMRMSLRFSALNGLTLYQPPLHLFLRLGPPSGRIGHHEDPPRLGVARIDMVANQLAGRIEAVMRQRTKAGVGRFAVRPGVVDDDQADTVAEPKASRNRDSSSPRTYGNAI